MAQTRHTDFRKPVFPQFQSLYSELRGGFVRLAINAAKEVSCYDVEDATRLLYRHPPRPDRFLRLLYLPDKRRLQPGHDPADVSGHF